MQKLEALELNYQISAEINTTPSGTATYASLTTAFKNIAMAINENVYNATYLSDGGFGSAAITGASPTMTLTGDFITNDAACIYLDSIQYEIGSSRNTDIKITRNGKILTCPCTLTAIAIAGGDSTTPNSISITIAFNGKPTLTTAGDAPAALALSSIVPAADATAVARSTSIVLTFNNKLAGSDNIFLVNSLLGTVITCTKSYDTTGKIVTLVPSSTLAASTRFAVVVAGVTDIYSQSLADTVRYFTTGT